MDTDLLVQAIAGDGELLNQILDHFPLDLVKDEVSLLSKGYQVKFERLEAQWRRQNSPTFNPDNPYYDLSLLRDGDRVTCKHSPHLGVGTVEIRFIDAPNFPHTVVMVHFDSVVSECYYPNQLERA